MDLTPEQHGIAEHITREYLAALQKAGIPAEEAEVKVFLVGTDAKAGRYERLAETVGDQEVAAIYKARARAIRSGTGE